MKRRGFLPALLAPAAASLLPKFGGGEGGGTKLGTVHADLLQELQALKEKVAALEARTPVVAPTPEPPYYPSDFTPEPFPLSGYQRRQIAAYGSASMAYFGAVATYGVMADPVPYDLAPSPMLTFPALTPLRSHERRIVVPRIANLDPVPIVPPTPDAVPILHPPRKRI